MNAKEEENKVSVNAECVAMLIILFENFSVPTLR